MKIVLNSRFRAALPESVSIPKPRPAPVCTGGACVSELSALQLLMAYAPHRGNTRVDGTMFRYCSVSGNF